MRMTVFDLEAPDCPVIYLPMDDEGYFHATELATRYGKRIEEWLSREGTKSFIKHMSKAYGLEEADLTRLEEDPAYSKRVYWFHPILFEVFAHWAHPEFSAWCDAQLALPGVLYA